MKPFILALLLVAVSAKGWAQERPVIIASVGTDSAFTSIHEDTLHLSVNVGDTVAVRLDAREWPTVISYYLTFKHGAAFNDGNDTDVFPLDLVDFVSGTFLQGPDLPTSQSGIVVVNGSEFQAGIASLGERTDEGAGFLGVFRFKVSNLPRVPERQYAIELHAFTLEGPRGATSPSYGSLSGHLYIHLDFHQPIPVTSDFNDNGVVDFADFLEFARVFGKQKGKDDTFDARFDLEENDQIDFGDFLLFASHFGKAPVIIRYRQAA